METRTEGEETKHGAVPWGTRCSETLTFVTERKKPTCDFKKRNCARKIKITLISTRGKSAQKENVKFLASHDSLMYFKRFSLTIKENFLSFS